MINIKQIGNNQLEMHFSGGVVLFSYQTPVAALIPGKGWLKTSHKWSVTTSKHINKWINPKSSYTEMPQEFFDNLVKGFDLS